MRCPKCQYISFDNSDRCRNCGYEFSLSVDVEDELDLPIRTGDEAIGPLADFVLSDGAGNQPSAGAGATALGAFGPTPPARSRPSARRPSTGSLELPLFKDGVRDDDAPLVRLPAVPRVADVGPQVDGRPRPRGLRARCSKSSSWISSLERRMRPRLSTTTTLTRQRSRASSCCRTDVGDCARRGRRVAPAPGCWLPSSIGLLLGMDAVVLHLTLKICGLRVRRYRRRCPPMPFVAFLVLLNGGYVAAFTAAGGQTIGKMLTGIRVVTSEGDAWTDRVPVGPSACARWRTWSRAAGRAGLLAGAVRQPSAGPFTIASPTLAS